MDASKLTKDEFKRIFGHAARYGCASDWQDAKETLLYYKFSGWVQNEHSCWRDCGRDKQWNNIKHYKADDLGKCLHLYIILDKSPCKECSDKLIELKEKNESLQISIKFSSFYNTYGYAHERREKQNLENIQGLISLVKKGVNLYVFNGESDWKNFLEHVVQVPVQEQDGWLECIRKEERIVREKIDEAILECIRSQNLTVKDIQSMASVTTLEEMEEEKIRRNGAFLFQEERNYDPDPFHAFCLRRPTPDFMVYLSRVGTELWTPIRNIEGSHAEDEMIKHISSNESLHIVAENSPCWSCCDKLIEFKEKSPFLSNISIKFCEFNTSEDCEVNMKALVDFVKKGHKLELIHGSEGWEWFLKTFSKSNIANRKIEQLCEQDGVTNIYVLEDIISAARPEKEVIDAIVKLASAWNLDEVKKELKKRKLITPNQNSLMKKKGRQDP